MEAEKDPSTLSNCDQVRVRHLDLELGVDFPSSTLAGTASLTFQVHAADLTHVILDTCDLVIVEVSIEHRPATFELGPASKFGRPLKVTLLKPAQPDDQIHISIRYTTTPQGSAVQWLQPNQTASGTYPFCFTQCQAIHARSLVPCQDSPKVKATYSARITVDPPLVALMSALRSKPPAYSPDGIIYFFEQPLPIPSYLIALAVGNLHSKKIGPRSQVWAEPDVVDAAAEDFSQTEDFLLAAESICGRYEWTRYDILCLPPSFPYGGMENPCLTFVTPTLLTGDKSLANVVAHEIAHSWHGNLVTNVTWEHFWLNEGFTVYVERKIMGKIYDDAQFHFQAIGGWKHLQDDIEHFGSANPLTHLCPKLDGIDPDDAFSAVPYEKGFNLLVFLETLFGRTHFEAFLKKFIEMHRLSTVSTAQFQENIKTYFADQPDKLSEIDWDSWFHTPGMPPYKPNFDQTLMQKVNEAASGWMNGEEPDISRFTASQLSAFLDVLLTHKDRLRPPLIEKLESRYGFSSSRNAEIKFRWYSICIHSEHSPVLEKILKFITSQGRMKYVRPLYRDLFKSRFGKDACVATFLEHCQFYHPIAAKMISHDLQLE